jgi:hypothetical protein
MTSFAIDKKSHKDAKKQSKIRNMTKSSNPNEVAVAKKKLKSKIELPPNPQIEGLNIVDLIVTEIQNDVFEDHMHKSCKKGQYYCYTDKKCKKIPDGKRLSGKGRLVGIDDNDDDDNNENGGDQAVDPGGFGENVVLRTCTGEKFAEIIDLIRPEDVMPKMHASDQWVNETLDDKRLANVQKQKSNTAATVQSAQKAQSSVKQQFAKRAAAIAKSKAKAKERQDISKEIDRKLGLEELHMTIDEAVRLPSEFGNIVMVGVNWRGKMYNLKMFFPQAKMPTRTDVQDEIVKVYPGGKVIWFDRYDLASQEAQWDNDKNPIIKVTKESKELCDCDCGQDPCKKCGKSHHEVKEAKAKYDNTKSPDYEKKRKALAKKHGGEENIKGHPQYENRFASHTAGMSDAQKDMASSQVSKGFAYKHGRRLDKANFGDRKKAGKRGNPAQYRKSADSPEMELRYPYGKSNIRQGKGSIKDLNKVKKEELLKSLRGFMDEGKIADAMRANLEKLRASDEKSQKNLEKFLKGTKQVRDDEKKAQDSA